MVNPAFPRPLFIHTPQAGFGLIEVLIAVLVLSFGLIGLASLQMFAARNNQSALERSMIVVQTYSIVDAMRADRSNAINHEAFEIGLDDAPSGTTFAQKALAEWRQQLINNLGPNATGSIDCDGPVCTITIQWNDSRGAEGEEGEERQVTTEVQL